MNKYLYWEHASDDECEKCGEEACQTTWTHSKTEEVIVVRDCDPSSYEELP